MESTLTSLPEGESGVISALGDGEIRGRLMDLGFTPGAAVTCLFSAPSGEPRAYLIRGSVIALRRRDAETIGLEKGKEGAPWA